MLKVLNGLPGLKAHPQKNKQCSPAARMQIFRIESSIKRATCLSRRDSFLSSKDTFLSSRDIYLSMRTKNCRKRRLICSCVRGPIYSVNRSILFRYCRTLRFSVIDQLIKKTFFFQYSDRTSATRLNILQFQSFNVHF